MGGFMGKISSGEKFLRFQNPTIESQKQENTEKTRFRVPMHFRTKRFTFKKIPPPPLFYTLVYILKGHCLEKEKSLDNKKKSYNSNAHAQHKTMKCQKQTLNLLFLHINND